MRPLSYCEVDSCSYPWGYSSEFLVGVCRLVLQILTLFQTKICHFSYPFSDLASKIHTRFQTWRCGYKFTYWLCCNVIKLCISTEGKNWSNSARTIYYMILFGVEETNTFIRSHCSLENDTRFQTKMVKIYTRFQTKTTKRRCPLGRYKPI